MDILVCNESETDFHGEATTNQRLIQTSSTKEFQNIPEALLLLEQSAEQNFQEDQAVLWPF